VAADALVVVDEVAAAVEDELPVVHLDRPGMVRGVAVHDVHAAVDETVGERALVPRHVVPPVAAPVDGDDDEVARAPSRPDAFDHAVRDGR
jgi:hypothetical protein